MRRLKLELLLTAGVALALAAGCATAPKPPESVSSTGKSPKVAYKSKAATKPPKIKSGVTQFSTKAPSAPPVPAGSEIVMNNGMVVTASTPEGKITVSAGPGLLRSVSWDGTQRYVVMKPRTKRLYGSMGIYFEGQPDGWAAHKGIRKIKIEEGQRQFDNIDDAAIWMQIRRLHYVHTNDGLVVGWKRKTAEATLQVEVWQFFIDGKKPSLLPGAKDYLIQTRQAPVPISANAQ